jgi:hypothetical protein
MTPEIIPIYYLTQVWAGLETFSFCKYAIYVEGQIKIAPLFANGYNPKQYKYNFPKIFKKTAAPTNPVICWGAIAVYKSQSYNGKFRPGSGAMEKLDDWAWPIDFGDMNADAAIFEALLEIYVEGNFVDLEYIYQVENERDGEFVFIKEDVLKMASIDNRELIGAFKWKMLDKNEIIIDKKGGFIEQIMPQIQIANETSKKIATFVNLRQDEKEQLIRRAANQIELLNKKNDIVNILKSMI